MKKALIFLSLTVLFTVSCKEEIMPEQKAPQVSDVSFTPCQQSNQKSTELSDVVVEFINNGVNIIYYNFEVTCDFTTVNVAHTFVNGVLNITQQGFPSEAKCKCYTDVSYTITGISQNEINVIFINGKQVYCHNDVGNKEGYVTFGANYGVINCLSSVTVFLDGKNIGVLQSSVDFISDCFEAGNLTEKISVGAHTYRVEIRGCCTKDILGTFVVSENECKKIFIDYYQVFANQSNCDQNVIISPTEYDNAPNFPVYISDMKIVNNCLKIKYSSSGCSGNTWVVKLIDLGVVAESFPCQRTLRFSFYNEEICAAVFTKETSFNIEDLQIQGNNSVLLNISGNSILYEY